MIRNSNCATKIAESQRTWKQNHLFLQKESCEICEIREICEFSNSSQNLRNLRNLRAFQNSAKYSPRNLRAFQNSAKYSPRNPRAFQNLRKNSAKLRERKAQSGNNLRRNWFIGGCPISWRRPTLPHSHAVPSARTGLTALFGMGRGVPRGYNRHCLLKFLAYSTHINAL